MLLLVVFSASIRMELSSVFLKKIIRILFRLYPDRIIRIETDIRIGLIPLRLTLLTLKPMNFNVGDIIEPVRHDIRDSQTYFITVFLKYFIRFSDKNRIF